MHPQPFKHEAIDGRAAAKAFKVAHTILETWGCSMVQKEALLGMKKSAMYKKLQESQADMAVHLTRDQLDRVSYILNIHQALRLIFSNQENVQQFMNMPNHNPYFNGKTPLDIASNGALASLYEVYQRIDALRSGGW